MDLQCDGEATGCGELAGLVRDLQAESLGSPGSTSVGLVRESLSSWNEEKRGQMKHDIGFMTGVEVESGARGSTAVFLPWHCPAPLCQRGGLRSLDASFPP